MSATGTGAAEDDDIPSAQRVQRCRRSPVSTITLRILAVNLLALLFLGAGILYHDEYRRGLINAELRTLETQANLFAAALAESATSEDATSGPTMIAARAQQMLRSLVEASGIRARLFDSNRNLVADSLLLRGPRGSVQIEELPPPASSAKQVRDWLSEYDRMLTALWQPTPLPAYSNEPVHSASAYREALIALNGEAAHVVRQDGDGHIVLSVAVPIRRYEKTVGSLMLSKPADDINKALFEVRKDLLTWFLGALAVTVLLSLYLSGTIARPLRRLAEAAEDVRRDRQRRHTIPDFDRRRDEIGQLAGALREMTDALWLRMDAIERFAADVAHELKNPLTSLNSAVETVARVNDPERRQKLLTIIQEDVSRLNRLISDIADASRLDAEMSRGQSAPIDVVRMFRTLKDVTEVAAQRQDVNLALDLPKSTNLYVHGMEDRLVQVFRNLLANALSFSPPQGIVTLHARREGKFIVAEVLDQGPGIPEGSEQHIFRRFYSARPKSEQFGTHSGLGLSISKQIVEAHDGTIHAENRKGPDGTGCGARFIVRLPRAVMPAPSRRSHDQNA